MSKLKLTQKLKSGIPKDNLCRVFHDTLAG